MSTTYIPVALRKQVYKRGKGCCEYCLIPDIVTFVAHEIDHIIAEKHGGLTQAENLALSCTYATSIKEVILHPSIQKQAKLHHCTILAKTCGMSIFNFKMLKLYL